MFLCFDIHKSVTVATDYTHIANVDGLWLRDRVNASETTHTAMIHGDILMLPRTRLSFGVIRLHECIVQFVSRASLREPKSG